MQRENSFRHFIIGALLACYLLPVLLLTAYTATLLSANDRWQLLSIGLLCTASGTLLLLLLIRRWEGQLLDNTPQRPVTPTSPLPTVAIATAVDQDAVSKEVERLQETLNISQQLQENLSRELQTAKNAHQRLMHDKEELQQRCEGLEQNLEIQKEHTADQLRIRDAQLQESQQTVTDQQALLEKRQKQITSLENSVRDLKYELKTLIDLTERIQTSYEELQPSAPEPPPFKPLPNQESAPPPPMDASAQLKRCIDIAQKLTGARHLSGATPRFQDSSVEGYNLDLRRLCDSLGSENSSVILLYSQKEDKLLFVNNLIKQMAGWAPEKFVQDFPNLIVQGKEELFSALRKPSPTTPQSHVDFAIKSKTGEALTLRCLLGLIPTGIFKTHVIGVVQN